MFFYFPNASEMAEAEKAYWTWQLSNGQNMSAFSSIQTGSAECRLSTPDAEEDEIIIQLWQEKGFSFSANEEPKHSGWDASIFSWNRIFD